MTPRPDLSNHAVTVEAGDAELSCIANPRYSGPTFIAAAVGTGLSMLPMLYVGAAITRYIRRGRHFEDLVEPLLYGVPFLLAMAVLINVLIRLRRPRGIRIQMGVVTLFTPDDPISKHVFELNNLDGAALVRSRGGSAVDLQLTRRRGLAVTILRGYSFGEIGHVVDLVNAMVNDDRSFAFEVIPLARPIKPAIPIAPAIPQPPPDRL